MRGLDSSIDNIRACAFTGTVIIGVATSSGLSVRNARQTPRGARLFDKCANLDSGIVFNKINLCQALEKIQVQLVQSSLQQDDYEASQWTSRSTRQRIR